MANTRKTSLEAFRKRQKNEGNVRVEVRVRKEDAVLLRSVARALRDPTREAETRSLLKARFVVPSPVALKALLASAPLDGIELERSSDLGRPVNL